MIDTQDTPKLSLLQQFVQQRDAFIQNIHQLQAQLQRTEGAIFACNQMIAKIEEDEKEKENLAKKDNQGENVDGEINSEQAEQPAQE